MDGADSKWDSRYISSGDDSFWLFPRNVLDALTHLQHRSTDDARVFSEKLTQTFLLLRRRVEMHCPVAGRDRIKFSNGTDRATERTLHGRDWFHVNACVGGVSQYPSTGFRERHRHCRECEWQLGEQGL